MLKTKHKIRLARSLQILVMAIRNAFGLPPVASVARGGLHWQLDLREGIDFSIWLLGCFEPETVRCYSRLIRAGDTVLDVGANIGAHTLPIARLVGTTGRVIAFEPTDYAFTKLAKNVAANPAISGRIRCVQTMLVDVAEGFSPPPLYSSWPLASEAGSHAEHQGRLMASTRATATSLDAVVDELALERVDCIKLDIDGFECQMLRGSSASLARWQPAIVMELAPYVLEEHGGSVEEMLSLLYQHGYSLYALDGRKRLPADPIEIRRMIPDGASLNVLARVAREVAA